MYSTASAALRFLYRTDVPLDQGSTGIFGRQLVFGMLWAYLVSFMTIPVVFTSKFPSTILAFCRFPPAIVNMRTQRT